MRSYRYVSRLCGSVSLAALIAGTSWQGPAHAAATDAVETVIVTARKRTETAQSTPVTLQVFSEQKIKDLNLVNFNDYVRFTPSVSYNWSGPGQTTLVIRGIAASTGDRSLESPAALYLDEQPLTAHALMPDPRIVDVERIEVLPGPQGTLFGASSESGLVRIITNKPKLDTFEGSLEATGGAVAHGAASYDVNGVINIPLVDDELAVRLVAFDGKDGGFIDNVKGVTPGGTVSNAGIAGKDINGTRQSGARAEVRWKISDAVSITGSAFFQTTRQTGPSSFDPSVGDLKTVRFYDELFKDKWEQYALTLNADLGFADLVATSGFFHRNIHSIADNTAYMQFLSGLAHSDPAYYSFYDFGPDPIGFYDFRLKDDRISNEVRLSSKGNSRWNWIVGAFYQTDKTHTVAGAHIKDYPSTPSYASVAAYLSAPTDAYFYQRVSYDRTQVAVFGELSYDITDKLTATVGGRYFDAHNDGAITTDIPEGRRTENSVLKAPQNGFTPKAELAYKWSKTALLYATYSEGFRLGGANRQKPGLAVPLQYKPDTLKNYEIGAKTEWFDGRLQLNAAAYWMQWQNFQLTVKNPNPATYYFVTANVGQAEVKGFELQVEARPIQQLTLGAAATILDAALSKPSNFLNAPAGTRLPVTPEVKFSIYADYAFPLPMIDGVGHLRADVSHTGNSVNNVDPASAIKLPAYTTANFQLGAETDKWSVNLFVKNAFDERATLYINPAVYAHTRTPNRPRELGLTVTRRF